MALDPEKLSQQPLATAPGSESDLFYSVQNGQTRRMPRSVLRNAIVSGWQGFVGTFLSAADTDAALDALGAAKRGVNTDITSISLTEPLSVASGGTASTTAAAARVALGVLNSGVDHINGLTAVWNSATSISITGGSAYIPSSGTVISVAGTIVKSGLATNAATWYHAYLYLNAGVPDVEISTTAPSAKYSGNSRTKTGDASHRYLFSFLTGAANTILRFKQCGTKIYHLVNFAAAPFEVLTAGVATVSTPVALAGCVPVTAVAAQVIMLSTHTNAASVFVNDADMGAVSSGNGTASIGLTNSYSVDLSISASQTLNYIYTVAPTGGGFYLRVQAYTFER